MCSVFSIKWTGCRFMFICVILFTMCLFYKKKWTRYIKRDTQMISTKCTEL